MADRYFVLFHLRLGTIIISIFSLISTVLFISGQIEEIEWARSTDIHKDCAQLTEYLYLYFSTLLLISTIFPSPIFITLWLSLSTINLLSNFIHRLIYGFLIFIIYPDRIPLFDTNSYVKLLACGYYYVLWACAVGIVHYYGKEIRRLVVISSKGPDDSNQSKVLEKELPVPKSIT